MEKIVIIGGGFAGLNLAKKLDPKRFQVALIDRNNFHCFPPLFYQVASSSLAPSNISFPFRREFKKYKNVSYHMGHVKNVDVKAKTVTTSYETLTYDRLVIAAGTTNNFFGMPGLPESVFCIKTVAEATHTRDEILDRLERGAMCPDKERRRQLLSFLVVGGGPSGVEIAGALGEMKRDILPREYPELDPDDMSITLVEGSGSLLGPMSPMSQSRALKYLKDLLVDVRLKSLTTGYKDKMVTFSDGHQEYWETLIWTAGVCGESIPGLPQSCLAHGGRISVDRGCRLPGFEESIYAIGDIALMTTPNYPKGHPQVAQPAIQQAKFLAKCLNNNDFSAEFEYKDKGSMATVGKARAVADLPGVSLGGLLAWLIWMFIHLISILGMRNKINILLNWMWNYCSYSTALRLLLRPSKYPLRRHWGD
ncbi:MAG: NAD(P)/FAD-dependent oxidoreductase [Muribaculaceae bacterium]|nr:NAD(P)/FAD-dependent oxidoreductase [Muribaculaceae bacterium]